MSVLGGGHQLVCGLQSCLLAACCCCSGRATYPDEAKHFDGRHHWHAQLAVSKQQSGARSPTETRLNKAQVHEQWLRAAGGWHAPPVLLSANLSAGSGPKVQLCSSYRRVTLKHLPLKQGLLPACHLAAPDTGSKEHASPGSYLLAMPLQCRSSPYSLMILPSSPSGHVLTSCSAVSRAEGPMRMSRGPGRVKLNPRSARSSCSRRFGRQSTSRVHEADAVLHTVLLQKLEALSAGLKPHSWHCSCREQDQAGQDAGS